jgi:hypothetical protein
VKRSLLPLFLLLVSGSAQAVTIGAIPSGGVGSRAAGNVDPYDDRQ